MSSSVHELERETRELRQRITSLEKRVAELEGKREPVASGMLYRAVYDPPLVFDTNHPGPPKQGLEAVIGKWPGDETDDEIFEMLEEM